jgi:hypothetical protein
MNKVYKFTIDVAKLNASETLSCSVDKAFKDVLVDVDKYIGYTDMFDNDSKVTMYFYNGGDDSIMSEFYDVLLDYRLIIDMVDITSDIKLDYSQFPDIDDVVKPNYNLLRKFLKSEFDNDFILDYISKNGESKFKNEILEKFFPNF